VTLEARLFGMQAAFLGPEPSDDALAALGNPGRLRVYRALVRAGLFDAVRRALPRTVEALGADAETLFDAFLAEGHPKTRYYWRIPLELAGFLETRLPAGVPPHARDLLRYESNRWRLRNEAFDAPPEFTSLSFDRPPVLTPARALLRVGHRVDVPGEAQVAEARILSLHRDRHHRVAMLVLNETSAALLEAMGASPDRTLSDIVQDVARARGVAITPSFIEKLSTLLESMLAKGLLLGSLRAPSR